MTVTYFRRDLLRQTRLVGGTSPERKLLLQPAGDASSDAVAIRDGWLGVG